MSSTFSISGKTTLTIPLVGLGNTANDLMELFGISRIAELVSASCPLWDLFSGLVDPETSSG